MMNKGQPIDFIAQPYTPAVDNTETVVVVLNELAQQLGARLTFSEKAFQYDDSAYRTACGVQKFTLDLINDLTTIIGCKKEFIRVFSVIRASSVYVSWGITTPGIEETKVLAEQLKYSLNQLSKQQQQGILQYLIKEPLDYKWGAALSYMQLQASDFDPRFNRDYPQAQEETRGGRPYYFPQGWYRHALKVEGKYPGNQVWLGMNNSPGEWAVAYHGTKAGVVRNIINAGLKHQFVTADACADEAKLQRPGIPNVNGLYVATHCEGGASIYTGGGFPIQGPQGTFKTYHVAFQCRVENDKYTEHKGPVNVGLALRVFDEKAIRPYGILLKIT
jgi:hypothetical protein